MAKRRRTLGGVPLVLAVALVYIGMAATAYLVSKNWLQSRSHRADAAHLRAETVRIGCSGCHLYPQPDILPRAAWWKIIHRMTRMEGYPSTQPPPDTLVAWYEARAPEVIALPPEEHVPEAHPRRWQRRSIPTDYAPNYPFIANVELLDLVGDARLELVATDMSHGMVLLGRPYEPGVAVEQIAAVPNPAHIAPVDLDSDGRLDLVTGNLGSLPPMDHNLGSVDWLRRTAAGRFERVVLFDGVGRVADTRPADFDGDGDWDLTVGEFGYRKTGQVGVLENRAPWGAAPRFDFHQLDPRHGSIHTAIADLDQDGRPDVVAALAQEHEMVVGYLNQGGMAFEILQLHRAPHPAWGTSGMQLVDLDADGDLDVLLSNGDMFDDPSLKPYHGVEWLEQTEPLRFTPHPIARIYAAHRAAVADPDNDGDLDIVTCSFMPEQIRADAEAQGLHFQSVMWLEANGSGQFVPHAMEVDRPRHPTLTLADYDLDGDVDLVVGNGYFTPGAAAEPVEAMELWENLGATAGADDP